MAPDRAVWGTTDGKCGLGPRPRAASRPHVRPRGRGLPDRLYRARRDCRRAPGHRQGNHRADYVGAAAVGRKARRPGQGQGVGRQALSQMTESRPLGRDEREAKGGGGRNIAMRAATSWRCSARPPRARRHRRLRPNSALCRRDRPLAGGRRHHTTSGPDGRSRWRCVYEGELK